MTGPARVEAVSDKKKRHRDELGLQTIKNIINVKNKGGCRVRGLESDGFWFKSQLWAKNWDGGSSGGAGTLSRHSLGDHLPGMPRCSEHLSRAVYPQLSLSDCIV